MSDKINKANKRNVKRHIPKWEIFLLAVLVVIVISSLIVIIALTRKGTVSPALINIHRIYSGEIVRGDTSKKQVIFTFDGGSGLQSGDKILEVLAKHGIKGTFFLTGKFVEANPDFVRRIVAAGHEVFNHTYDHPHLPTMTDREIVAELNGMDRSFIYVLGDLVSSTTPRSISTRPYFRPPYGDRDLRVREVAARNGYQDVFWTVDAHDWEESTGVTAAEVTERIIGSLAPGNIYLMHIGDNITGQVLDNVFTTIEDKGYRLVSLTQGI